MISHRRSTLRSLRWRVAIRALLLSAVWLSADAGSAHAAPAAQIGGWESVSPAGTACGRGAPFTFFINPAPDPDAGILIYLNGGGVCIKDGPAPPGATGIAAELHCMSFSNFEDGAINRGTINLIGFLVPFFNRGLEANPFRDMHFVAVPYCTGDVHAGLMTEPHDYDPDPDARFDVTQRGHLNLLAVLDELERRFPDTGEGVDEGPRRKVVLTGASAGGFGAIYNYPAVQARWPETTLLPDAGIGPGHWDSLLVREGSAIAERWGARAVLPDYCPSDDCMTDTLGLLAAHARFYDGSSAPWRPFGMLQGQQDSTLSEFLEISRCEYQLSLRAGLGQAADVPNLRAWVPATSDHVFSTRAAFTAADGTSWLEFIGRVAAARSPAELPPTVVDPWLRCNDVWLPALKVRG